MAAGAIENIVRTMLAQAAIDRSYRKVFAIGFNKTGTTSIHRVFEAVGLRAVHSTRWGREQWRLVQWTYQAFSDGEPQAFQALDRRFPRSRFLLNVRDLDEWLDSRIEHGKYMETWQGQHRHPTPPSSDEMVQGWVRTRNAHHSEVLDYFSRRPDDLLVVNFIRDPDGATKIARFLGGGAMERPLERSVPKRRDAGVLMNAEQIGRCLGALGVPQAQWKNDLLVVTRDGGRSLDTRDAGIGR